MQAPDPMNASTWQIWQIEYFMRSVANRISEAHPAVTNPYTHTDKDWDNRHEAEQVIWSMIATRPWLATTEAAK